MTAGPIMAGLASASKVEKTSGDLKSLKKACDGLESSFLRQMLSVMRQSVKETPLGGDDTGADTYKGMFDDAVADSLAEHGTLGISKMTFQATAGRVLNEAFKDKRR